MNNLPFKLTVDDTIYYLDSPKDILFIKIDKITTCYTPGKKSIKFDVVIGLKYSSETTVVPFVVTSDKANTRGAEREEEALKKAEAFAQSLRDQIQSYYNATRPTELNTNAFATMQATNGSLLESITKET